MKFNSIGHLINYDMLKACHNKMDGSKAVGTDGTSKADYNENLEENLRNLVQRLKNKSYRLKPARKVEIPKDNGKTRLLSVYTYEDKLVQEALREILEAVFEPHFYENMCGFRPNRSCHGAIRRLNDMIEGQKTNYILDADISGFFDNLSHEWIIRFISSRITDPNIIRLVERMLKAGVLKEVECTMSFKVNECQQLSLEESFMNLTDRERKALEKSWAKILADEIFSAIDEQRFSVLYSDKASRPNTPVNVIIGALIIKELFDYSDDEIVENLMFDLHIQYTLHTTSFAEQPLSDKTLIHFRKRYYDYETLHSVDLYHDCVKDFSGKIARIMKLNGRIRRMDSMMIESNIRFLSRIELIYTCISKLIVFVIKNHPDKVVESLKHYADPDNYNRIFYYRRNDDMDEIIQTLLTDNCSLLDTCNAEYEEVTEYQLFVRCLSDQTVIENGKRRLRTKEDGTLNSSALQNPSDTDATYRNKAGKLHRGYAANIEETVGKNGSVVIDYQFDKNNPYGQPFSSGNSFTDGKSFLKK